MKPKISIIIPTYNEENYVEETLKSIREQKFKDYELIVSDCYSEDNTVRIAEKYADKIIFSKTRSTASARNLGASIAKGKYFIFVDADTLLCGDYLEKAYEIFKSEEYIAFSGAFKFSNFSPRYKVTEKAVNFYFMLMSKFNKTIIPGFNFCIFKNVFNEIGGFEDVFIEDANLCTKLNKIGKTGYFTHFYVTTSSRRLEKLGLFGTLDYYCDIRRKWNGTTSFLSRYIKID